MSVSIGASSIVKKGLVLHLDPAYSLNYILSEVEVLVVAGGGGGGGSSGSGSGPRGGGGAGGLIYRSSYPVTPGSAISLSVGAGGAGGAGGAENNGTSGQNSTFGNLTAVGGGYGAAYTGTFIGGTGGSGGGSSYTYSRSSGTQGQGFAGGCGGGPSVGGSGAGGGGGAGGPGRNGINDRGGNGGAGLMFNISGFPRYYAGGGGAGIYPQGAVYQGIGGIGGGGDGSGGGTSPVASPGAQNTGGGGGGGGSVAGGGTGGSGIVIVRYRGPQKATGGTITQVGGYTIHSFTSTGSSTFTPNSLPSNGGSINGLFDLSENNATASQSGGVTYNTNNLGSLNFDGTNDQLIGNLGSPLNAPFTMEFFGRFNNTTQFNYEYFGSVGDMGTNTMASVSKLGTQDGNAAYRGFMYIYPGFGGAVQTNIDLRSTSYQHIVIVLLPFSPFIRVYKNGVEGSMVDSLTGPINTNGVYRVGTWQNSTWWLNGNIGNCRIYNRALSLLEIQQNYSAHRRRFGI